MDVQGRVIPRYRPRLRQAAVPPPGEVRRLSEFCPRSLSEDGRFSPAEGRGQSLPTGSMGHRPNLVPQGEGGRLGFMTVTPAFPLVWGMDILWRGGDSP